MVVPASDYDYTVRDIFVYGTLMPGQPMGKLIPHFCVSRNVRARTKAVGLFTNGAFPIAVIDKKVNEKNTKWIEGRLLTILGKREQVYSIINDLDTYEGVDSGLFYRHKVTVQDLDINREVDDVSIYSITESHFKEVKTLQEIEKGDWANWKIKQ